MSTLETRIRRLEKAYSSYEGQVPGTSISRVQLDHKLCAEHGVEIKDKVHEADRVWCLGLGGLSEPKIFFYGHTISECFTKAERAVQGRDFSEAQVGFASLPKRRATR